LFTNPQKKNPEELNMENEGAGNGSPSSYTTIRKLLIQKGTNTTGVVEKCFHRNMTQKVLPIITRKLLPVTVSS
jgi:hypothetical protein